MKYLILSLFAVISTVAANAYALKGVIVNTNNDSAVSEAIVLLLQNNKVVSSATANFLGEFSINAKKGKTYTMEVVKDGYKTETAEITIDQAFVDSEPVITVYLQPLSLNPSFIGMEEGLPDKELNPDIMEDIGDLSELPEGYKIIEAKPLKIDDKKKSNFNVNLDKEKDKTNVNVEVLKETFNKESVDEMVNSEKEKFPSSYYAEGNIYYGPGKAKLTNTVKEMLNGIAAKMKNEGEVNLSITAFADADQELIIADYICKLRAEEITKHLIDQGINFERLSVTISGNTALENGCVQDVACNEFQHQENRKVALAFTY